MARIAHCCGRGVGQQRGEGWSEDGSWACRTQKRAWASLWAPRALAPRCHGSYQPESEARVLAPAWQPTCSMTLGRSLAHSGLQAVALQRQRCWSMSPETRTSRHLGGQPQLSGLFLLGQWAVTRSLWNQNLGAAREPQGHAAHTRLHLRLGGLPPQPLPAHLVPPVKPKGGWVSRDPTLSAPTPHPQSTKQLYPVLMPLCAWGTLLFLF